eukprot:g13237.t1
MQKGSWAVARCLLRAGATWPFVFDTKLEVHGQAYNLPHVPLSMKDAHYHFCRAAETGNTTMIVSYIASGMDMDYGLCWTPSLTWYTTVLGHAAFHRQKEVVRLLTSWGSSSKKSVSCLKKRKQCRGNSCFNCYSACEAYHSKDDAWLKRLWFLKAEEDMKAVIAAPLQRRSERPRASVALGSTFAWLLQKGRKRAQSFLTAAAEWASGQKLARWPDTEDGVEKVKELWKSGVKKEVASEETWLDLLRSLWTGGRWSRLGPEPVSPDLRRW